MTDVRLLVTKLQTMSYRFPVSQTNTAKELDGMQLSAQKAKAVMEHLRDTCGGCGWFVGEPDISVLAIVGGSPGRNVLARPGTEHLHVLPVDEDQVLGWIDDGSVERRRVLLVDTKGRPHARC